MWIKQLTLLKDASVFIDVCKLRGGACEKKKTGTRIGFSFLSGVPVREKRDVAKIGEYRWPPSFSPLVVSGHMSRLNPECRQIPGCCCWYMADQGLINNNNPSPIGVINNNWSSVFQLKTCRMIYWWTKAKLSLTSTKTRQIQSLHPPRPPPSLRSWTSRTTSVTPSGSPWSLRYCRVWVSLRNPLSHRRSAAPGPQTRWTRAISKGFRR